MRVVVQRSRSRRRKEADAADLLPSPPPYVGGYMLVCLLALTIAAMAHDSPEHKVTELSFEIVRSGKTPELLMQRGIEHRALGQLADAAADFEAAFQLDPKLAVALKELSLIQLAQGKGDLALRTINRLLVGRDSVKPSPDFLIVRAEIHTARKNYRAALRDCEAAFQETSGNLEWYLLRAQLQRQLGMFDECLSGLREGLVKTGSAVLQEECIEAMIDAGQHKAALKQIESELADSRWRSSWLIRRARARLGLGQTKAAQRDLRAALKELNERIVPNAPEVTLVIDRGVANALLEEKSRALEDLRLARMLSPDAASLWRLERLIGR
jgi:tetratricopeptide (TPR) repeat protein